MNTPTLNDTATTEWADRGVTIYDAQLKDKLEPAQNGWTVAIHLDSSEYAVAHSSSEARRALRLRQPAGPIVTMLVGPDQYDQLAQKVIGPQFFGRSAK